MKIEKFIKILRDGNVVVPKIFLKHYKDLNLTEEEFIVLLYFFGEDLKTIYNPEEISKYTAYPIEKVLTIIDSLTQKKMVEVSVIKNEEGVFEEYISIDPLYEKITYLIADINNKLNEREKEKTSKNIFEAFEKEFSRSLSPMEYEIIMKWIEEGFREEIILEALKEAILNDVRSLRYIDRILIEWRNKKLDTIEKIREYSKNYKLRSDFEDTDNEEEIFHYNWLDNE